MRSELWDVTTWPALTDESAIKARVRRRARSLLARRVTPVALVAVVALAGAVVSSEDRPMSSSRVRVGPAESVVGGVDDGPAPASDGVLPDVARPGGGGAGMGSAPSGNGGAAQPSGAKPRAGGAGASAGSPTPPGASGQAARFTDPTGDAVYPDEYCDCEVPLARNTRSQPGADITGTEVGLAGQRVRAVVRVLDLAAQPEPNMAQDADVSYFRLTFSHDGVEFAMQGTRRWDDGTVRLSGLAHREEGFTTSFQEGVSASFDLAADTVVIEVTLDALNTAMARDSAAHPRIGVGTTITPAVHGGVVRDNGASRSATEPLDSAVGPTHPLA